jgi:Fe-Mn family superoxide dismutase
MAMDQLSRRDFVKAGLWAAAAVAGAGALGPKAAWAAVGQTANPSQEKAMYPFALPPLPWADNVLEPVISAKTIGFHYGKHHQAYVTNLNNLVKDTDLAGLDLEAIIKKTAGDAAKAGVFNNAAQVWNHTFYWQSMKPGGGGQPTGNLLAKINSDLGGFDKFKQDFSQAALTQFGSGWAWLSLKDGKLAISKTPNAESPLASGAKPLITLDVWEHAYYLDYQNRRADYIKDWLEKLVNWDFAAKNLAG